MQQYHQNVADCRNNKVLSSSRKFFEITWSHYRKKASEHECRNQAADYRSAYGYHKIDPLRHLLFIRGEQHLINAAPIPPSRKFAHLVQGISDEFIFIRKRVSACIRIVFLSRHAEPDSVSAEPASYINYKLLIRSEQILIAQQDFFQALFMSLLVSLYVICL